MLSMLCSHRPDGDSGGGMLEGMGRGGPEGNPPPVTHIYGARVKSAD